MTISHPIKKNDLYKISGYASIVFTLFYCLGYFLFGEKLPIAGGLGWDGVTYAAYASNFFETLKSSKDIYHFDRLFPSLVIYAVTQLLHLPLKTPSEIVNSFLVFNSILIIISSYLWYKICQTKNLNQPVFWIGYISFFLNYACLKFWFYDPVLTDTTAFFFGMLILYLYLSKKYFLLTLAALPACLTWPIVMVCLAPLLIFSKEVKPICQLSNLIIRRLALCLAGTFIVVSLCMVTLLAKHHQLNDSNICYQLLPLSILIVAAYIYITGMNSRYIFQYEPFKNINYKNLALLFTILFFHMCVMLWLKQHSQYSGEKPIFTPLAYIQYIILGSITKPALFLVAHFAYWGPIVILFMFYFKEVMASSLSESFGFFVFILLTLATSLESESRHLTFNYPFIVYAVCAVMNKSVINKKFVVYYLAISFLASKIYYYINAVPLVGDMHNFPMQRFFMNLGPWMGWYGYNFNLLLLIIGFFAIGLGLGYSHRLRRQCTEAAF